MIFVQSRTRVKTKQFVPILLTILNANALPDGLEISARIKITVTAARKQYVRKEAIALTLMEDLFVGFFLNLL